MDKKELDHLSRLERRADHLARRIAGNQVVGKGTSYDKAELSALNWAIETLQDYLSRVRGRIPRVFDRL